MPCADGGRGGRGGRRSPEYCQISKKVGQNVNHAAKEVATGFSGTIFIVAIVGRLVKTSPLQKVSQHITRFKIRLQSIEKRLKITV